MFKKKYHGIKLKILLGLLLINLIGLFNICFASEPTPINQMTPEIARSIFKYFYDNHSYACNNGGSDTRYQNFYQLLTDENIETFVNRWNSYDFSSYAEYLDNCLFVTDSYNGVNLMSVVFTNNSIGSVAPHLAFYLSGYNIQLWNINDNGSYVSSKRLIFQVNETGTTSGFWTGDISSSTWELPLTTTGRNSLVFTTNPNTISCPVFCCYSTKTLFKYNGAWYFMGDNGFIPAIVPEPTPTPTPEPTPIPGTGTITNNSGDKTGNIDLSGIENSLSNIENKIPNSGEISNSITQANQDYWGDSSSLTGDSQMSAIEDSLNGVMDDLSDNLSDNEVFNSIQEAEDGFLDLFRNQQEETAYDLKFEWDDFEYNDVVLIPKGSINLSQLCRDNVQLGYVQGIIRVVFNFEVALTLLYQVWNLILATLGIDNPFLYEDYDGVERINGDTGEVHTSIVRRKRFYRKGGK